MSSFDEFNLPPAITRAVKELGFDTLTPIQEKAIPFVLDGKDVVGQAATGSGKTAAFGLPILGKIHGPGVQMLVLTPTRELCNQVMGSMRDFARYLHLRIESVYGGVGMGPQIQAARTANIIIACPGRLLDLMGRGAVNLKNVQFLVLDEADRMFDMGFIQDVEKIIRQTPSSRQTLLFSATIPPPVRGMVHRFMHSPIFVETKIHVDKNKLRQMYFEVRQEDKFAVLVHLLKHETPGMALVFCNTRRLVDKVVKNLRKQGIESISIHGGLSQNRRDQAISAIHHKETAVLVATDIAARGLHLPEITHVYNYDLPTVPEDYTHRIGRTARAGADGDAITLLSQRDQSLMRPIMRIGHEITRKDLPHFDPVKMQQTPGSHGGSPSHGVSRGHFRDRNLPPRRSWSRPSQEDRRQSYPKQDRKPWGHVSEHEPSGHWQRHRANKGFGQAHISNQQISSQGNTSKPQFSSRSPPAQGSHVQLSEASQFRQSRTGGMSSRRLQFQGKSKWSKSQGAKEGGFANVSHQRAAGGFDKDFSQAQKPHGSAQARSHQGVWKNSKKRNSWRR